MPTYCCVPFCNGIGVHKFPRASHLRQQWIAAIKRDIWRPTATSMICESHFKAEDYWMIYGYKSLRKVLRASAVPSQFDSTPQPSLQDLFRTTRLKNQCNRNGEKSLEVPDDKTSASAIFQMNVRSILKYVLLSRQNINVTYSTVSSEQPFQCELCCESFADLDDLTVHGLVHARDLPHKCQVCLTSFPSSFDLHFHEKIHAAETQHRCQSDPQVLAQTKRLKTREKTNTSEKKSRYILPARDCTEPKKYRYILPAIGRTEQRPNACEPCVKVMTEADSPKPEIKTEKCPENQKKQKPIKCLFCDRSYKCVSLLKAHIRIHAGQKPYSCLMCDEAFAQTSLLNAHMTTHTLIPYSGDEFCESSSKNAANRNVTNCVDRGVVKNNFFVNSTMRKRASDAAADLTYAEKRKRMTFWSIQNGNIYSVQEYSLPHVIPENCPEQSLTEGECCRKESTAYTYNRSVAAPYGCGVCDEMFEIEKEFFEHCSNHFEDPLL